MNIKVYDHIIVMGQCQTKLNMCAVSPVSAESVGVIVDTKDSSNHTKKRIRRTRSKIIYDIVSTNKS
jgi:hypothetical protein